MPRARGRGLRIGVGARRGAGDAGGGGRSRSYGGSRWATVGRNSGADREDSGCHPSVAA